MTKEQDFMSQAEGNIRSSRQDAPERRKFPVKAVFTTVLGVCFAVLAVNYILNETGPVAASYETIESDSTAIIQSAVMLQDYIEENGSLPEGFLEHVNSSDGLVELSVNDDGSFSYTENGVTWQSSPGLLAGEGTR